MFYFLHATAIVGYSYQADNHCVECIRGLAKARTLVLGSETSWGDSGTAEEILSEWAFFAKIDPYGDNDTGDFPRVIFASDVQGKEYCGSCREPLIDSD